MQEIDFVAEIIYLAYERLHRKQLPVKYNEAFEKFFKALNNKQKALFREFEMFDVEFNIDCQREAFKFILRLMCPNAFP